MLDQLATLIGAEVGLRVANVNYEQHRASLWRWRELL
jgi:hypothetical protein